MAPLNKAQLTVEADVDSNSSGTETGVFDFTGNLEITPGIRTGYLIGGRGSTINAIIQSYLGNQANKRRGIFLDLGGGAQTVEIKFRGWDGSGDVWGDTSAGAEADATNEGPLSQMAVLIKYLNVAEIDSRNPATLEYGEWSSGGRYEPLDVVVEGPNLTAAAEDGSWFDGTMTFVSAADVTSTLSGQQQDEH